MVNTVRAKVKIDNISRVVPYEHIACVSNDMLMHFGKKWLDKDFLANCAAQVLKDIW